MQNFDAIKILGSLLSSGALSRGSGNTVLGSIIGAVMGGGNQSSSGGGALGGGGLGDLVGGMLSGGRQSGGRQSSGLEDLLGGLLGGGGSRQTSGGAMAGGMGDLIGMAIRQFGAAQQGRPQGFLDQTQNRPGGMDYREAEDQASLLIKVMINAAKADGNVDREEQEKIIGKLGEITPDEADFIRREMASPLNVEDFIRSIPRGLERQVYTVSLMAIDLDTNQEARYLHEIAQGTGISPQLCNQIHQQLGVPQIYR